MSTIFEIISTKRSAHHAFIGWIAENAGRPLLFFNNIVPSLPPRIREAALLNAGDAAIPQSDLAALLLTGEPDAIINFEGKLVASIEDWNRDYLVRNTVKPVRKIVFLRDPLNTFASLAYRTPDRRFRSLFNYFYQVVAFETIMASVAASPEAYERVVTMERWQSDAGYRGDLARQLGLETSALPSGVSRYGGGSSFEGASFDPSANASALFERWRRVEEDPLFLAPFADPTSREAIRAYFGLFGKSGRIDAGAVSRLLACALGRADAVRCARDFLAPMRRALPQLVNLEKAHRSPAREIWKVLVRLRVQTGL